MALTSSSCQTAVAYSLEIFECIFKEVKQTLNFLFIIKAVAKRFYRFSELSDEARLSPQAVRHTSDAPLVSQQGENFPGERRILYTC